MRSVEDELWWYRVLRDHVLAALKSTRPDFDLLDAGCGSGGMLARIRAQFPAAKLTALDFSEHALAVTAQRNTGAQLVRGSVDQLPFADAEFDFVLSLDVLTVRGVDQPTAIREAFRVLRANGRLILNLPAFDFLRGSHDVAVNQDRRVRRGEVAQLLHDAGFAIVQSTYWNMTLTPLIAPFRFSSRGKTRGPEVRSDLKPMARGLNRFLTGLTKAELALSRIAPLPFGSSLFVVARK